MTRSKKATRRPDSELPEGRTDQGPSADAKAPDPAGPDDGAETTAEPDSELTEDRTSPVSETPDPAGPDDGAETTAEPDGELTEDRTSPVSETPDPAGPDDDELADTSPIPVIDYVQLMTPETAPVESDTPWSYDDVEAAAERPPGDLGRALTAGLATIPYLGKSIRRRAKFCCVLAAIGLLAGLGLHKVRPVPDKASVAVEVTNVPGSDPYDDILTNIALVDSRAVAGKAVHALGLDESAAKFLASYTATEVTDQIISITVTGPSSIEAVRRANAIAGAFLQFQAAQLQSQQNRVVDSLNLEINSLTKQVAADNAAIAALPARRHLSPAQNSALIQLENQRAEAENEVSGLQAAVLGYQIGNEIDNDQVVSGSEIVDPAAPVRPSKLASPVVYPAAGLLLGLVVGVGLVLVEALVSDRLRRRDDVARALAAPVELSVGRVRAGRFAVWDRLVARRARQRERDMERIVVYLGSLVPDGAGQAPGLAVVPVGKPGVAALAVVRLAVSCAQRGIRVMVADLDEGRPVARLLGDTSAGVRTVTFGGQQLILAVPDQIFPIGPLHPQAAVAQPTLASAYHSAELLLTLATADPALGLDNLPTWATRAVVMVTAGECSAARIHAAGEVIRLSGTQLTSAILLDADTTDNSVSLWPLAESDVARRQAADLAAGQGAALELHSAEEMLSAMVGDELAKEASDLVPPDGARRRK